MCVWFGWLAKGRFDLYWYRRNTLRDTVHGVLVFLAHKFTVGVTNGWERETITSPDVKCVCVESEGSNLVSMMRVSPLILQGISPLYMV